MNVFIVKLYIRNNSRASNIPIPCTISTVTCDKDTFLLNEVKNVTSEEIELLGDVGKGHWLACLWTLDCA